MFPDISLKYIFIPILALMTIFKLIYKAQASHNKLDHLIYNFKITVIQLGVLLGLLILFLPLTQSLSIFEYPKNINSINTNEKILNYLQKYNQAIVRTTEVVF